MPSGEDTDDPAQSDTIQASMAAQPAVPTHMFPISDDLALPPRSKRRQVKKACTNCQKACKKCDDGRPCKRCITYGTADECVDTQRKERKRGIKRGPYKKRDNRSRAAAEELPDPTPGALFPGNAPAAALASTPATGAFIPPVGYPPGLPIIPQQPARPGEGPTYYYIPVPVMAPPPPSSNGQECDAHHPLYPPHSFYPGPYFSPYVQAHAYLMHSQRGTDGPLALPPHFSFGPIYAAAPQSADSSRDGAENRNGDSGDH